MAWTTMEMGGSMKTVELRPPQRVQVLLTCLGLGYTNFAKKVT